MEKDIDITNDNGYIFQDHSILENMGNYDLNDVASFNSNINLNLIETNPENQEKSNKLSEKIIKKTRKLDNQNLLGKKTKKNTKQIFRTFRDPSNNIIMKNNEGDSYGDEDLFYDRKDVHMIEEQPLDEAVDDLFQNENIFYDREDVLGIIDEPLDDFFNNENNNQVVRGHSNDITMKNNEPDGYNDENPFYNQEALYTTTDHPFDEILNNKINDQVFTIHYDIVSDESIKSSHKDDDLVPISMNHSFNNIINHTYPIQLSDEAVKIINSTIPEANIHNETQIISDLFYFFPYQTGLSIGNFVENIPNEIQINDFGFSQVFNNDHTLAIRLYEYIYYLNQFNHGEGFFLFYFKIIHNDIFISVLPVLSTEILYIAYINYVMTLREMYEEVEIRLHMITFLRAGLINNFEITRNQYPYETLFTHTPQSELGRSFQTDYFSLSFATLLSIFNRFRIPIDADTEPLLHILAEYFYYTPYTHSARFTCQSNNFLHFSQMRSNMYRKIIDNNRIINFFRNLYHLLLVLVGKILAFFNRLMDTDIAVLGWINFETISYHGEEEPLVRITRYFINTQEDLMIDLVFNRLFEDLNYYLLFYSVDNVIISGLSFYLVHDNISDTFYDLFEMHAKNLKEEQKIRLSKRNKIPNVLENDSLSDLNNNTIKNSIEKLNNVLDREFNNKLKRRNESISNIAAPADSIDNKEGSYYLSTPLDDSMNLSDSHQIPLSETSFIQEVFTGLLNDDSYTELSGSNIFGYSIKKLNLNTNFKRNIMIPTNGSCFFKSLSCFIINKKVSNNTIMKSLEVKSEGFNNNPINLILGERMKFINLDQIIKYATHYKLSIILWFKSGNSHFINVTDKSKNIINLLIIKTEINTYHVCYIFDVKSLFKIRILDNYCSQCNSFNCQDFNNHKFCINFNDKFQKYRINKEEIEYNERKSSLIEYVIYADIESLITPDKKHEPIAIGFFLISHNKKKKYYNFTGKNCITRFIDFLKLHSKHFDNTAYSSHEQCSYCGITKVRKIMLDNLCIMKLCYNCENFKKLLPTITIIFHNFRGYDSHFLISEFSKVCKDFVSIPLTKEKNLTFSGRIGYLFIRFIDSYSFLASSLDSLSYYSNEKISKTFFPYEYFDNISKLHIQIPTSIEDWRSSLKKFTKEDEISLKAFIEEKKDYTLIQLLNEYLMNDVNLLYNIFEKFREIGIQCYNIDPIKYISLASYTWDCFLKSLQPSNVKIFRLRDEEIISLFTRKGVIRGGMTMVSNHRYLTSRDYKIFYLDVNNLYGKAMMFPLPYEGIFDVTFEYQDKFLDIIQTWSINSDFGFIFELDIEEMGNHIFSSFPLFPVLIEGKLIQNLRAKRKYVAHIITIQQGFKLGYRFNNVRKILKFKQRPILFNYVNTNHIKRLESENKAYKNFYKSMNNSLYGKTIENIFKRSNYLFSSNEKELCNKLFDEKILYYEKYSENLFIAETNKILTFDKPVYLGFTILEYSKYIMFDLYYENLIHFSPKLCYVDTDSFILGIHEEDSERFKSSNFISQEEIGKLKIEHEDIKSVIALKSKEYAISFHNDDKKPILKGKGFSTKNLFFLDYLKASFKRRGISFISTRVNNQKKIFVAQRTRVVKTKVIKSTTIRSQKHTLSTITFYKNAVKYGDPKAKFRK